jgi:hypothetical protein
LDEAAHHESTDLYEVLEVSPRASQRVIQAAYRVLAQNSHPDVNSTEEAGTRIRQLNAAYHVLGNTESRARYDLERTRVRRQQRAASLERGPHATLSDRGRLVAPTRQLQARRPALTGATIAALTIVAAVVTALVLVLLWVTLDTPLDDNPAYQQRPQLHIEVVRR